jgi:hypothetical protein
VCLTGQDTSQNKEACVTSEPEKDLRITPAVQVDKKEACVALAGEAENRINTSTGAAPKR